MFKKTLIGVGLLLLIFSVGCSNNSVSESSMHSHDISSKYHEKNNNSISEKIDDTDSTEQDYDLDSIDSTENTDISFTVSQKEYSIDDSKISYTIKNYKSSKCFIPAYTFTLEKYINNKWETVPFDIEFVFKTLDRILEPNEEITGIADLEKCYNLPLKKGIYRISKKELKSEPFIIK